MPSSITSATCISTSGPVKAPDTATLHALTLRLQQLTLRDEAMQTLQLQRLFIQQRKVRDLQNLKCALSTCNEAEFSITPQVRYLLEKAEQHGVYISKFEDKLNTFEKIALAARVDAVVKELIENSNTLLKENFRLHMN